MSRISADARPRIGNIQELREHIKQTYLTHYIITHNDDGFREEKALLRSALESIVGPRYGARDESRHSFSGSYILFLLTVIDGSSWKLTYACCGESIEHTVSPHRGISTPNTVFTPRVLRRHQNREVESNE